MTGQPTTQGHLTGHRRTNEHYLSHIIALINSGFQARSKDQEILEEGGGAGPSTMPRRDHE